MSNCLICYPNNADTAVLSGGSWEETLPLDNLKTRFLSQYARTTDLRAESCIIDITFYTSKYITAVALVRHNLSLNATCRVQFWGDAARTLCTYDSGVQDVFTRWYDTKSLRWGDSNFWGGKVKETELTSLPPVYLQMLGMYGTMAKTISTQYATITLYDPTNEDGYLQVGRLYLAEDWTPAINMSYGATLGWVDPTVIDTALDGTEYFEERSKYRQAIFKLEFMSETDGTNRAMMMSHNRGTSKDILFVFDPSNKQLLQQRSFVGRLEEISPLEYPNYAITSMSFKIKELV